MKVKAYEARIEQVPFHFIVLVKENENEWQKIVDTLDIDVENTRFSFEEITDTANRENLINIYKHQLTKE